MAPIFSLRSILSIVIGLVIGLAAGFGYSAVAGSNVEFKSSWPPVSVVDESGGPVYETSLQGRILPGSYDEAFIKSMDLQEQYYAARMGSLPFLQYFSDAIAKQYPQYSQTAEDLSRKVKVSYVVLADNPSVIEIKTGYTDSQEALFIVQNLPRVFEDYLLNEQNKLVSDAYQNKVKQVEATRAEFLQSSQDMVNAGTAVISQDQTAAATLTSDYIKLAARIAALQTELTNNSNEIAQLLAEGAAAAVTPAATGSAQLSPVKPSSGIVSSETDPAVLDAEVKGIQMALEQRAWVAAGFTLAAGASTTNMSYAQLSQALNEINTIKYANALKAIELTSAELSKAKTQMNDIQSKIDQAVLAKNTDTESKKQTYTLATAQVTALRSRLETQTQELAAMSQTVPSSQIYKFYTSELPQAPAPASTGNTAPLLGAILGMFCGWMVVNRRWLAGGSSRPILNSTGPVATGTVIDNDDDRLDTPDQIDQADHADPAGRADPDGRTQKDPRKKRKLDPQEAAILAEMKNWETRGAIEPSEKAKTEEDDWLKDGMNITPEGKDIKDDQSR